MSEASEKLAMHLLIMEHETLVKALREMAAFEQALGSKTAHYAYSLEEPDRTLAKKKNLIRVLESPRTDGWRYRLTAYGREVAHALNTILEAS